MKLLNRSAFVVLPKQPFVDWTNGLNLDETEFHQNLSLEEQRQEGTVYLVDEVESEEDFTKHLVDNWKKIFENELSAWDEMGDDWPNALSYETFQEWFDLYPQVMALDLSQQPLMTANLNDV